MLDEEVVTTTDNEGGTDDAAAAETEARAQGWRPKAEYEKLKGADPDKWVDAATFIELGEKRGPILRDQNRKLNSEMREMKALVRDVLANQKASNDRAVADALAKLQGEKRTAVEEADPNKVEAIDKQIDKLKDGAKERVETRTSTNELPPEFSAWERSNKWFRDDPLLQRIAIAQYDVVSVDPDTADLSDAEKLKLVSAEVRKRYPEKFANPNRKNAAQVESGTNGSSRGNGKHSYGDLPQEAKDMCDRLVKSKVLTRDEYVAKYQF